MVIMTADNQHFITMTTSEQSVLQPTQQMISSSVGALFVSLFTTPFEVVKVRLQAQVRPNTVKCSVYNQVFQSLCYCTHPPAFNSPVNCTIYGNLQIVPKFSSTTDAFFKIAKIEGLPQLWKGLSPTLVQMLPQTVIYFTIYDQLKYYFGHVDGKASFTAPLFAGVISRSFAVFCVSPIEMFRTKFQSKIKMRYGELFLVVRDVLKQDGILSMWRGIGPTLLRDVPFSAIYWLCYESLKSLSPSNNFMFSFSAGALSGMTAAALTQPFDVVKTHRQMELGESSYLNGKRPPFTFAILIKMYRQQGLSSLFTGVYPRLGKIAPACAIMMSTYEYGKEYYKKKNMIT